MADITNNQIRDELKRILDEDKPKSNTLEKAYEKVQENLEKEIELYEKRNKLLKEFEQKQKEAFKNSVISEAQYQKAFEMARQAQFKLDEKYNEKSRLAHKKNLQEYINADLNGKHKMIQRSRDMFKEQIEQIEQLKFLDADLYDSKKEELKDLYEKVEKLDAREKAMSEAKRKARLENANIEIKIQDYQDRFEKRREAALKSELEYREELIAAEKEFGSIEDERYRLAKEKADERRKERDREADNEFGISGEQVNKGLNGFFDKENGGTTVGSFLKGNILAGISESANSGKGIGSGILAGLTKSKGVLSKIIGSGVGAKLSPLLAIVKTISNTLASIGASMNKQIMEVANTEKDYLAKINTRLVGINDDMEGENRYKAITEHMNSLFSANAFVNQKSLLGKIAQFTEKGVAFNIEQRALIAELQERMVSTFDALDEDLLRLIRLQQTDVTTAALGSEAQLTNYLNQHFDDTSYLNTVYDAVNASLLDAQSQMSAQDATDFMYVVQKWLGSLYSVGMSSSGVEKIAQGINYLATGNFEGLNNDDSLRTLFGLATSGAYSDLLVNGINAENVNAVLNNIVSYLADIAGDTNQVTKNVKAGLLGGMSLSDIRAVSNLTTEDLAYLNSTDFNYTWNQRGKSLKSLINDASVNTSGIEQINNIIENSLFSWASNMYEDREDLIAAYIGTKFGNNIIGKTTNILSSILHLGDTISTASDIAHAVKAGAEDNLLKFLSSGSGSVYNISSLISDNSITTNRGSNYAITKGVMSGISTSKSLGISTDIGVSPSLNSQATASASTSTTKSSEELVTATQDLYNALFKEKLAIRVIIADLEMAARNAITSETYKVSDDTVQSKLDLMRLNFSI